jgi:hypothetical protein
MRVVEPPIRRYHAPCRTSHLFHHDHNQTTYNSIYTLNPNRYSRGSPHRESYKPFPRAARRSKSANISSQRHTSAAASPRARNRLPRRRRVAARCVVASLSVGAGNHLFECVSPCCEPWTFNIVAGGQVAALRRAESTRSTPFDYSDYPM